MKTNLSRECDLAFMKLPREVKHWLNEKSRLVQTSNNLTMVKIILSDYREYLEKNKKSILSFSGGKDSTALLLMMLEKGMHLDYILFCDTTEEWPQMYEHIDKVDDYIKKNYGMHITRIKSPHSFLYWMTEYQKTKGHTMDIKGFGWGTFKKRWCTKALKILPIRAFMAEHGLTKANTKEYVGIAADEPKRIKDKIYPLFEWGITEKMALEYCYSKGFHWGGLYDHNSRLSCWLCPLQNRQSLKNMYMYYPEMWERLKKYNELVMKCGHKYQFKQFDETSKTLDEWEEVFKKECAFESRETSLF